MGHQGGSKQSFKLSLFLHSLEVIAGLMLLSVTEWGANSTSCFNELGASEKNVSCIKQVKCVIMNFSFLVCVNLVPGNISAL